MFLCKEKFMGNIRTEVYIFGASVGGKHVYDTFINLGVKVLGFIDNNENKWGTMFQNVMVYAPNVLQKCTDDQKIVIASTYHDEIRAQLLEMKIREDKIVMKDQIIRDALGLGKIGSKELLCYDDRIIFDLSEGFMLSGVVNWSINLIEQLHSDRKDVRVLSMKIEDCNYDYEKISDRIHWIDYNLCRYREAIQETMLYIENNLPCKVIINQISQVFWAAVLVKQKYGDKIEIVSVIHSDFSRIYEQNAFLDEYIDQYICVSKDIQNTLMNQYNIDEKKLHYRATSIEYDKKFVKVRDENSNAKFRIAYAARLEKAQKRADLLIPLIALLNDSELDYELNIAGNGTYYNKLEKYIQEQHLTAKVKLHGALSYDAMKDFWKRNDIFINLSDIEGMPVSLLEAMSWGVVPIATRTSGIQATIENGVNGYICDREDVDGIFAKIQMLYKDKCMLDNMSEMCRKKVEMNHDRGEYVKYLMKI